ncbi:BBP7 family outer membrane beta-barrel protein [bacterium]|nr:BBP7 family outer membrane beta-barrel protein [bacterium]
MLKEQQIISERQEHKNDSTRIGIMTRWLSGIAFLICGLLPLMGSAQDSWQQSGFPSTGYIGQPGPPGGWGDPYAQLRPGYDDGRERKIAAILSGPVQESWIRFELLHWRIKGADDTLIGAPVAPEVDGTPFDLTARDRSRRLQALDRVTGARPQTFAVVPRIGDSEEPGQTGFRGSFGIPTTVGDFEFNGFVLEEYNETVRVSPFIDNIGIQSASLIGAVSLLNDGVVVNDTMILFNQGLNVNHTTSLYGFEANLVNLAFTPNVDVEIRPIIGVRYLNLEDNLNISGTDIPDAVNDPTNILNHRISSSAQNHIFGPQVGFRASSKMRRFTLGTDVKLLLGVNRVQDQVRTEQIFTMDELPQTDSNEHTEFAPTFDFSVYGKFAASDHINLLISYQALVGARYSRSYDTIRYNAPAAVNDPPDITAQDGLSKFYAHGLTLGLEIIFP